MGTPRPPQTDIDSKIEELRPSLEPRFWSKVDRGCRDECWEWTAYRRPSGYGRISVEGESRQASRIAYALEVGAPGDKYVLHTCDNKSCVNPSHLYLGDHSDNMQDMADRTRDFKGENCPAVTLTASDVEEIRDRLDSESQYDIAEDYGVTQAAISRIACGETWSHSTDDTKTTEPTD